MGELIPEEHLVRVVNRAVDEIDIQALLEKYKGGGHECLSAAEDAGGAYVARIYSSRQIEKALRENVNFMWLSGMNRPDHRTINGFWASSRFKI